MFSFWRKKPITDIPQEPFAVVPNDSHNPIIATAKELDTDDFVLLCSAKCVGNICYCGHSDTIVVATEDFSTVASLAVDFVDANEDYFPTEKEYDPIANKLGENNGTNNRTVDDKMHDPQPSSDKIVSVDALAQFLRLHHLRCTHCFTLFDLVHVTPRIRRNQQQLKYQLPQSPQLVKHILPPSNFMMCHLLSSWNAMSQSYTRCTDGRGNDGHCAAFSETRSKPGVNKKKISQPASTPESSHFLCDPSHSPQDQPRYPIISSYPDMSCQNKCHWWQKYVDVILTSSPTNTVLPLVLAT